MTCNQLEPTYFFPDTKGEPCQPTDLNCSVFFSKCHVHFQQKFYFFQNAISEQVFWKIYFGFLWLGKPTQFSLWVDTVELHLRILLFLWKSLVNWIGNQKSLLATVVFSRRFSDAFMCGWKNLLFLFRDLAKKKSTKENKQKKNLWEIAKFQKPTWSLLQNVNPFNLLKNLSFFLENLLTFSNWQVHRSLEVWRVVSRPLKSGIFAY